MILEKIHVSDIVLKQLNLLLLVLGGTFGENSKLRLRLLYFVGYTTIFVHISLGYTTKNARRLVALWHILRGRSGALGLVRLISATSDRLQYLVNFEQVERASSQCLLSGCAE